VLTTAPEDCAVAILKGVPRGKKRVVTGNQSAPLCWLSRLMPNRYQSVVKMIA
jgi:hypothetical protein